MVSPLSTVKVSTRDCGPWTVDTWIKRHNLVGEGHDIAVPRFTINIAPRDAESTTDSRNGNFVLQ